MTDARLPERWLMDRRVLLTSPEAWRLYTFALMYSVSNRTDGVIERADLALVPGVESGHAGELVKLGLWREYQDRWLILDFTKTQSSRDELDQLDRIRAADAAKKRRKRLSPGQSPGQSPGTAQARTGQARTGQAPRNEVPGSTTPAPDGAARAPDAAQQRQAAEGGTGRYEPAPSQSLRDHDGPEPGGSDAQRSPTTGPVQSQATDRYAREDAAPAAAPLNGFDWAAGKILTPYERQHHTSNQDLGYGTCIACDGRFSIMRTGTLRKHKHGTLLCPGSLHPPAEASAAS